MYEEFLSKYKEWAEKNDVQLLEIDEKGKKEPLIGFLLQSSIPVDPPPGLNRLAIRSSDDWDKPCTLEKMVWVNRYGWYYTDREVPEDYVEIKDWNYIS